MKLTSILAFVFVFGLFATGGMTLYNQWADSYKTVDPNAEIGATYNSLQDLYTETNKTYSTIEEAVGGEEDGNFLTNLKAIWRGIKLLGRTFTFGVNVSEDVANDLNLPAEIRYTILGLLLLAIIGIIITVAARARLEL